MSVPTQREEKQRSGWARRLVRCAVRERFTILCTTCVFIGGMFAYLDVVRQYYRVQGQLQFRSDSQTNSHAGSSVVAASYLERLADAVRSDDVLLNALRRPDVSQLEIPGPRSDALQSLRNVLQVSTDAHDRRIEIGMESPYPHHAARIVNAVMASLTTATTTDHASGKMARLIEPQAVSQLSLASGGVAPRGIPPTVMIVLAAGLGFMASSSLVLVRGLSDERIRSPEQILQRIGLRTAGYLPVLSGNSSAAGRGLATYIDPSSDVAVLCRALLLRLFGTSISRQTGSLLVTSPSSGEGSSTVALNLAITIAMAGEPVLLVDANLHSPILHKLLGDPDPSPGFWEGLDNPRCARDFIRPTHIQNLDLLPCGKPSSSAAVRLQSRAFSDVTKQLLTGYRYLIFDSGAATGNPDTIALASRCRATLLVLNARLTALSSAAACSRVLKQHGAKQMVAIVNALSNSTYRKQFQIDPVPRPIKAAPVQPYQDINEFGLSAS